MPSMLTNTRAGEHHKDVQAVRVLPGVSKTCERSDRTGTNQEVGEPGACIDHCGWQ